MGVEIFQLTYWKLAVKKETFLISGIIFNILWSHISNSDSSPPKCVELPIKGFFLSTLVNNFEIKVWWQANWWLPTPFEFVRSIKSKYIDSSMHYLFSLNSEAVLISHLSTLRAPELSEWRKRRIYFANSSAIAESIILPHIFRLYNSFNIQSLGGRPHNHVIESHSTFHAAISLSLRCLRSAWINNVDRSNRFNWRNILEI